MTEHLKWPKIESFHNLVKSFNRLYHKFGQPLPKYNFIGSVKLHGTNACIVYNPNGGIEFQSRKRMITLANDNAGFVNWFHDTVPEEDRHFLRDEILELFWGDDLSEATIRVYGEFAGKGINKGLAIQNVDKAFYIFGASIETPDGILNWVSHDALSTLEQNEYSIYNINHFETFFLTVNFSEPERSRPSIDIVVERVSQQCPVGLYHGLEDGGGEGIVWYTETERGPLRFKTVAPDFKEKVGAPKDRTPIDRSPFELEVRGLVTESRMTKILATMTELGFEHTSQNTRRAITLMNQDIWEEEGENLVEEFDATVKDVSKVVGRVAGSMYNRMI